jgi:hydroxymethylpyrimidine pyrophosphatase-like HAD family hydrolase
MLLALDYDETYTRDPIFWDAMIKLAIQRGHSVICATMRHESEGAEVIRDLGDQVETIIFTGRKAKFGAVYAAGYMPSVWIDDSPHWIHTDAKG